MNLVQATEALRAEVDRLKQDLGTSPQAKRVMQALSSLLLGLTEQVHLMKITQEGDN